MATRSLVGFLAVALVLATLEGCSATTQHYRTVTLAPGLTATLPAMAPKVTATPSSERAHHSAVLKQLAPAERVTAAGKLPADGVVLTFHVDPARIPPNSRPFLASLDQKTGRWIPVASSYDPNTGAVSARVPHFSVWAPLSWVTSRIAAMLKGALLSTFGFGGTGRYPQCGSYDVAVTDSHPGGAEIGSCAEMVGGGEVRVKIGNMRPYMLDITYPYAQPNAQGMGGSSVTIPSPDLFVKLWTADAAGSNHALLPGFGEADIDFPLPPGQSDQVTTRLDGAAFRAAMLEVAVRIAAQLGGKAKDIVEALDKASCALDYVHLGAATELTEKNAEDFGSTAFECVGSVLPKAASLLFTGVTLAASLVVEAISASWAAIDTAAGNAHHVLTVQAPAGSAPAKVYLRTAPTQGIQAGFRLYSPQCDVAESCPLTLVPGSGTGTSGLIALIGTQWSSWTFTEATGTGTLIIGTTTTSISLPVRVTLSRPVQACGHYYWSTAEFTALANNPPPAGHQGLFNAALAIGNVNDQPCPA
jgi:hypothetical protein